MRQDVQALLQQFARGLVAQDYGKASQHLASWIATEPGRLAKDVEAQMERTRAMMEGEEIGPPSGFELDSNALTCDELREDGEPLPADVTTDNFEAWCQVQVQADGGEWSWYDIWFAVVREGDQLRIGHYEVQDPD